MYSDPADPTAVRVIGFHSNQLCIEKQSGREYFFRRGEGELQQLGFRMVHS